MIPDQSREQPDHRGGPYAPQDRSLDPQDQKQRHGAQPEQGHQSGRIRQVPQSHQCPWGVYDKAGPFKTYEGNQQADSDRDRLLEGLRDGMNDRLSQPKKGQ